MERVTRRARCRLAALLSTSPAPSKAQERQHRRLLPAVGRKVSIHGRARRRQCDDGRLLDDVGALDGGETGRGNYSDCSASRWPRYAARADPTVLQSGLRPGVYGGGAVIAAPGVAPLVAQSKNPP